MSAETPRESVDYRLLRRLIGWNRFWLTLFLTTVILITAYFTLTRTMERIMGVETGWIGQTLHVSSIRGGRILTHLMADPPEGPRVVASLPAPIYLIDSEGASFTVADLKKLTWTAGDAKKVPAPAPGTKILALYYRAEYSAWKTGSP